MNFNNRLKNPFFEKREIPRSFLGITDLKLDFPTKIGGYTFLVCVYTGSAWQTITSA